MYRAVWHTIVKKYGVAMMQFSLRTLCIVTALVAETLSLWIIGGSYIVITTLVIGLTIGACTLILFRGCGVRTVITAIAMAVASEISGVYIVNFSVEEWQNPLGKIPIELRDLFWFAFWGAIFGGAIGVAFSMMRRAYEHRGRNHQDTLEVEDAG